MHLGKHYFCIGPVSALYHCVLPVKLKHAFEQEVFASRAELVAERVGDYVVYCTPDKYATEAQEFHEGDISLSNCVHDEYSVVDVTSKPDEKGFLLEVASAMTGLGVTIHEAIVQVLPLCNTTQLWLSAGM